MKKTKLFVGVILAVVLVASIGLAEDEKWFDMGNCDFCKNMSKDLMDHMSFEQHSLSNGVMIITTFPPEYKEELDKATEAMTKLGADMMSGKVDPAKVKMCGHCKYYGKMMEAKAKFEHVSTSVGAIDLITSDDEDVLKMINTYADNNDKAMAEMMQMEEKAD